MNRRVRLTVRLGVNGYDSERIKIGTAKRAQASMDS
jgi:hypothetical protein